MGAGQGRAAGAPAGRTIGVVAPLVGGFYFGGIIAGVTRAAARVGMRVIAVQTFPTRLARERHLRPPVPGEPAGLDAMDAVVVVTDALAPERLHELLEDDRPVVLVGTDEVDRDVPVLRPDNLGGARAAVDHLVAHGHTRIGFVGDLEQGDIRARHEGWLAALAAHGITPEDDWFHEAAGNTVPAGADAADAALRAGLATTAVLAATDLAAIGFLRGLQRAGSVLPRDQAVIGFDHTEGGARVTPRLSTVDPHHDRVGELAVAHVLARLRGDPLPPLHVPASLVALESCGCDRATTTSPGVPPPTGSPGLTELRRVARTGFAGPTDVRAARTPRPADAAWVDLLLTVLEAAAERGTPPTAATLRRVRDLTAALEPYPETLEQSVAAVRLLEEEVAAGLPDGPRRAAHRRAVTDVLLALAQGCQRPSSAREAAMERTIAEQYEVDMDVAVARGSARSLTWLPGGGRTNACLGLWTGRTTTSGGREIEVAGAVARSGTLARSVGRRLPAGQFPPAPILRAEPLDGSTLVFVVPVGSADRDWGLLAVTGRLDPRMLHSRERHQHWGALLGLALEEEERRAELQERIEGLTAESAERATASADLLAMGERQSLWLRAIRHAVWDWDVARGSVHWSPQWAELLGVAPEELTDAPAEWFDRVHPEDRVALAALVAAQLGGADEPLRIEHRVRHASGAYLWVLCEAVTIADDSGAPARVLGALVDVTERKERELALVAGVLRDPDTGLPNRAAFLDRLGTVLARARRGDADAALALLRTLPGAVSRRDTDAGPEGSVVAAVAAHLESAAGHGDVVGVLAPDVVACAFVDDAGEPAATRLAAALEALPPQQRRLVALGTLPSLRQFDDAADAVRAAEAGAALEGPGAAR